MTADDDAFIRTIVDNPGNDVPRLVYADWLDDRDDPRGPFLRAEVEWAQPWKEGTPPGWSKGKPGRLPAELALEVWPGLEPMQLATKGLDPLWVARISRPPLGVCVDHIKFRGSHEPLSLADVRKWEAKLWLTFHTDLVALLLNHHGGDPWPRQVQFRYRSSEDEEWHTSEWFIGFFTTLTESSSSNFVERMADIRAIESNGDGPPEFSIADRFIPIATDHHGGYWLLERWPGPSSSVWSVSSDEVPMVPELRVPSLPELFARILTIP